MSTETLILDLIDRQLRCIWEGDAETYRSTTAEDVSFYEWYISPQRIDGLDFHLREIRVHAAALADSDDNRIEHEILQPRVQIYDNTAIATYTLFVRAVSNGRVMHKSHHETRVFHNFGTADEPRWLLVHCHKSPIATPNSMEVVR